MAFQNSRKTRGGAGALLVVCLWCLGAQAALTNAPDVYFNYEDFTMQPASVRQIYIYPLSWQKDGSAIATLDRLSLPTGTNGSTTVSNMLAGSYRVEIKGIYTTTTNWLNVPSTNALINAADYIGTPTNMVTVLDAWYDGRYWSKVGLRPGANLSYRTNAGVVYIDADAGSSLTNGLRSAAWHDAGDFDPAGAAAAISNAVTAATNQLYSALDSQKQNALGYSPQPASGNLTNWSALAPATKQDALGFVPQPASGNLTNWSALATSAKQDASANLDAWSALGTGSKQDASANLTNWSGIAPAAKQDALGYSPQPASGNLTNWSAVAPAAKQDALGFAPQPASANLTNWSGVAPSAKQDASANLTNWSAIAPTAKQDALGFAPQPANANLTNWSALATTAKQDAADNLTGWAAIAPSAKADVSALGTAAYSNSAAFLGLHGKADSAGRADTATTATNLANGGQLATSTITASGTADLDLLTWNFADVTLWLSNSPVNALAVNSAVFAPRFYGALSGTNLDDGTVGASKWDATALALLNVKQPASANLTNWSAINPGTKADISSLGSAAYSSSTEFLAIHGKADSAGTADTAASALSLANGAELATSTLTASGVSFLDLLTWNFGDLTLWLSNAPNTALRVNSPVYASKFYGALSGTNLDNGTVSTNKWDATALAALNGKQAVSTNLDGWAEIAATNTPLKGTVTVSSDVNTNSMLTIDHGSIYLPRSDASDATPTHAEGIVFSKDGHASTGDTSNAVGRVLFQHNWGGIQSNGWLLLAAQNIRLETGWWSSTGSDNTNSGTVSLGNEDGWGEVIVNYTPLATNYAGTGPARYGQRGQPYETGWGYPLKFAVHGCNSTGYNYYAYPGIQARGVGQGDPAVLSYDAKHDWCALGELWFYSATPSTLGIAPNLYDTYPGVLTAKMRTNGWEFLGWVSAPTILVTNSVTAGSYVASTNGWAGPTNTLDLGKGKQFYVTSTACSVTGLTGFPNGAAYSAVLTVSNSSGSTVGFTIPAAVRTGDGSRIYYVTNAQIGKLSIECADGMTNAVFKTFW